MAGEDFTERKGQCLCGKVRVTAHRASNEIGVCHCGMCRKRSGGPSFAIDCGTEVTFSGEEFVSVYNSSAWGERGFCKECGSNLFFRLKGKNHYLMSLGLFEDDGKFIFSQQIFIDNKPAFYEFKNATVKMTGAEVFAKYN